MGERGVCSAGQGVAITSSRSKESEGVLLAGTDEA